MNCDILKSKLFLCEWNAFYFIEIAFIGFTLDEIKQRIVFFGTPGTTVRATVQYPRPFCIVLCQYVLYDSIKHFNHVTSREP